MTDRKLAILAMTAAIMAGWAVLQSRLGQQTGSRDLFQRTPLIQGLNVGAIAQITILSEQGQNTLTLKRQEGRFGVMEKDGYPANVSAINMLLNNCLDIRVAARITSNPANHTELGVADETARYAVRFFNAEGDEITGVLISEQQEEPEGAFVRLTTGDETYFVQSPPWISTTPMSYINTTLVEADRSKVRQVSVRGPQGDYVLMAGDGGDVVLEAMPEGKQFKGTVYQSVFGALGSVRFEDVMAAGSAPDDLVFTRRYVCRMEDSTVYSVRLARSDNTYYATISAEFSDQTPVQVGRTETEEELRKKEAKLLAMDAAQAFAQRHRGWVYVISSINAEDMIKPVEDLLEAVPEAVEEDESEPGEE